MCGVLGRMASQDVRWGWREQAFPSPHRQSRPTLPDADSGRGSPWTPGGQLLVSGPRGFGGGRCVSLKGAGPVQGTAGTHQPAPASVDETMGDSEKQGLYFS